jgi:hypothetical protein
MGSYRLCAVAVRGQQAAGGIRGTDVPVSDSSWPRRHARHSWGSWRALKKARRNVWSGWSHSARFTGILGDNVRLGPHTMLVTDFVREQEREKDKTANILELGIRRQVTPLTVLEIGFGTGIGPDSPDVRVTLAFQHTFGGWFSAGSEVTQGR